MALPPIMFPRMAEGLLRSWSIGVMTWRSMTRSLNPGAYSSKRSVTASASGSANPGQASQPDSLCPRHRRGHGGTLIQV